MPLNFELSLQEFFKEDDLFKNDFYSLELPQDPVHCELKFKSPEILVCGLPYFFSVFKYLGHEIDYKKYQIEGQKVGPTKKIEFVLPFHIALSGERIALNLLQRASSIATHTQKFVAKASSQGIKILDTRKTLPGYRSLEKYAVRMGGGYNHRFSQMDAFMIKDNHKNFFGGLKEAYQFFVSQNAFYTPIIAEIHDLNELKVANDLEIKHLMLDNFSPNEIKKAISMKKSGTTFEISGGITLESMESFLIEGVDAISVGSLTYGAPPVDISLKYHKVNL